MSLIRKFSAYSEEFSHNRSNNLISNHENCSLKKDIIAENVPFYTFTLMHLQFTLSLQFYSYIDKIEKKLCIIFFIKIVKVNFSDISTKIVALLFLTTYITYF